MAFDRARRQCQRLGDLAGGQAFGDQLQHFRFAAAELGKNAAGLGDLGCHAFALVEFDLSALDRVDQVLFVHRLAEIVDRAVAEGAAASLDVTVAADYDDRPVDAGFGQPLLKLQARDHRHAYIKDQASRLQTLQPR